METEIMNEILTLTVSQLFTGNLGKYSEGGRKGKYDVKLSGTAGSTAGSKMIEEMKSKYKHEEEEEKKTDGYKQG